MLDGKPITDPGSILVTTPQSIFLRLAFNDSPDAKGISATVDITDLWTLEAGLHFEPPKNLFTLFNVNVQAVGLRAGVSFQKLFEDPATGSAKVKIKLTSAGKALLKHAKRLALTVRAIFTPTGGAPVSATGSFDRNA